ncbi:MAG TPA: TonB-dependent receptor [Burkholderiales bacterium]|jgi:iron complex outermembrane receptor protein|nr:TonB-dependent receptor [Burkholderiales bacterium]
MRYSQAHKILATFVFAWSGAVFSQSLEEEELALSYGDKAFVSIATGSRQLVTRAPSVATVITDADIQSMGATDLDQVLETVPGLHVAISSGQYNPIYTIRGIYGEFNPQVLLLINGVPLKMVFNGNRSQVWAGMPVENIARIEVIRGPGSALYGADAFSGVINIITKTTREIQGLQGGVRLGSFDSNDAWIQYGGAVGAVNMAFFLRTGSTNGQQETVTADRQTGVDRVFGTNVSAAPSHVNVQREAYDAQIDLSYKKLRWRAGYQGRRDVGTGTGIAQALDPRGHAEGQRFNTDIAYLNAQPAKDWDVSVQGSYHYFSDEHDLVLFPPGASFGAGRTFPNGVIGNPYKYEKQYRLNVSALYAGFQNHSVRIGAGAEHLNLYKVQESKNFESLSSTNATPVPLSTGITDVTNIAPFMTPHLRKVVYVYAQDEWSFAKDWYLTTGLRYDHYSDFGGTTNPRLAAVWEAAYNLTAKMLYGRAFRAPTFIDLYNINNPVLLGNSDVKPEIIDTVELALSWQASNKLQTGLNLFQYQMKDIIQPVTDPTGTKTMRNTGKRSGAGFELEANWDLTKNVRIAGNYAYQRSIDRTNHADAGNAPRNHLYIRTDWRFKPEWSVHPQVNWIADRKREFGDTRPNVPDYSTVDLTLRTDQRTSPWNFAFSVRNLFNADAREPSPAPGLIANDFPLAGRSYFVEARFQI